DPKFAHSIPRRPFYFCCCATSGIPPRRSPPRSPAFGASPRRLNPASGIERDGSIRAADFRNTNQHLSGQNKTGRCGRQQISSAVLLTLQMPGRTRVKSRGPRWPQPSMPGPFRQVYLDVKGEQSIEQLRLAIKMMLAEPAARKFFAAVLE